MRTLPPVTRSLLQAPGAVLACVVLLAAGGVAFAQQPAHGGAPAAKSSKSAVPRDTRPGWAELTPDQQQALKPLAGQWTTMSEAQKRKWIALSRNYRTMAPADQARLRSRMTEWVSLSPQQRTQARLNFGEAKGLSPGDRKAKWEAYQALSPEEKRKLAAGAGARTPPTAAAVRPVPAQKLARTPSGSSDAKPPRIAAGPRVQQPAPAAGDAQN